MRELLEVLNALACTVIFGYCYFVAVLMPGGLRMWGHKLVIWGVTWSLGLQMAAPFSGGLSASEPAGVMLHLFLAAALIVWRAEAMHFVRCKFVPPEPGAPPRRRSTDWGELPEQASAMERPHLRRVRID